MIAHNSECLPIGAQDTPSLSALHHLPLVVYCKGRTGEDGLELTHDPALVQLVVLEKYQSEVEVTGDVLWRQFWIGGDLNMWYNGFHCLTALVIYCPLVGVLLVYGTLDDCPDLGDWLAT